MSKLLFIYINSSGYTITEMGNPPVGNPIRSAFTSSPTEVFGLDPELGPHYPSVHTSKSLGSF